MQTLRHAAIAVGQCCPGKHLLTHYRVFVNFVGFIVEKRWKGEGKAQTKYLEQKKEPAKPVVVSYSQVTAYDRAGRKCRFDLLNLHSIHFVEPSGQYCDISVLGRTSINNFLSASVILKPVGIIEN